MINSTPVSYEYCNISMFTYSRMIIHVAHSATESDDSDDKPAPKGKVATGNLLDM